MRYPGGKGRCYQTIVTLMKEHDIYVETHLGGGAVLRHKRPATRSIGVEIDAAVVERWRAWNGSRCEIVHGDAVAFLRTFPFQGSELVYSDPPYLPETRCRPRVYRHDYSVAQHVELLEVLASLRCAVIVSGYRSKLYDDMLSGWRSVDFAGDSHTGPRTETVWLNYAPPDVLHDHSHLGADFRERERVKRRRDGMLARIEKLAAHERNALIEGLACRYGGAMKRALERVA